MVPALKEEEGHESKYSEKVLSEEHCVPLQGKRKMVGPCQ